MWAVCVEEAGLPSGRAPLPLAPGPRLAEAHPLLDVSLTPDRGGGILRREAGQRRRGPRQVRFDVGEESSGRKEAELEDGGVSVAPLATPSMQSSAAVRQEVEARARQAFDVDGAVRSEMGRSYLVRRSVESRAAKALNVGREQSLFQGLVSVEPPSDQLQRLTVQSRRSEPREPQVTSGAAPDISVFSDAMEPITENPALIIEGLPPLALQPRLRPAHSSFTMFHKLREWTS